MDLIDKSDIPLFKEMLDDIIEIVSAKFNVPNDGQLDDLKEKLSDSFYLMLKSDTKESFIGNSVAFIKVLQENNLYTPGKPVLWTSEGLERKRYG